MSRFQGRDIKMPQKTHFERNHEIKISREKRFYN